MGRLNHSPTGMYRDSSLVVATNRQQQRFQTNKIYLAMRVSYGSLILSIDPAAPW
jgi:hypothetical protein